MVCESGEARLLLVEPWILLSTTLGRPVIERSAIRPLDADLVRYIVPLVKKFVAWLVLRFQLAFKTLVNLW